MQQRHLNHLKHLRDPTSSIIICDRRAPLIHRIYSEPTKYIAKLRDLKTDNNIQLLKCKLEAAGHGGSSGRDNAIVEIAEEYSFILKNAEIKDWLNLEI